jgi:uncharacterized protein (DUF1697 family)
VPSYAAFLRAVNVGGRVMKMAALREVLTEAKLSEVATYIQSGNVVFSSPMRSAAKVESHVESTLAAAFGFEVITAVRTVEDMARAVDAGEELTLPGRHMITVCKTAPDSSALAELQMWDIPGERAVAIGREVHAFYDKPYNEARLAVKLERLLKTPGTTREFRVFRAVHQLQLGR